MIRLVVVYDPTFNDLPPAVTEYEDAQANVVSLEVARLVTCMDVAGFTVQRVTSWFPATWRQILPGCEVRAPDGSTWVVARALSPASPHEVEIYRFGQPDKRSVFTPQYDQPVQARMTHEASMMALLVSELGARIIDDGS